MKALALFALIILLAFVLSVHAQQVSILQTDAPKATGTDWEQDGLKGMVRRVRTESAKIVIKEGKAVEGPRALRAIVTYNTQGRRLDTVAYPVENATPSGKEQYKYDDQGNIVEMVLRAADGSILGREIYRYEFDEFGNWKKMTTAVAVYEDGKLGFEPMEVTYRTITYYYNQAIEKIAAAATSTSATAPSTRSGSPQASPTQTVSSTRETATPSIVAPNENASASLATREADENTNAVQPIALKNSEAASNSATQPTISTTQPTESPKVAESQPEPAKKVEPKAVTEEQLRRAAISLPEPDYPTTTEPAAGPGKVEVQVIVDEKGNVLAAKSVSGESALYQAAEAAALKAHFSPGVLAAEPTTVFGVISYNFSPARPTVTVAQPSKETSQPAPESTARSTAPTVPSKEDAATFYQRGVAQLRAGHNSEALEALKRGVYLNPQDAAGYGKLGLVYAALGQNQEAIAAFKIAIQISPDALDAEENYRLGEAYTAVGKHSDAVKAFKQALNVAHPETIEPGSAQTKQFPTVVDLHFGLGLAYYNAHNYGFAIKELKQATRMNPELADAHYGLALAYIAQGQRELAQSEERILRKLNIALANNVAALLPSSIAPGTNRILPGDYPSPLRPRP